MESQNKRREEEMASVSIDLEGLVVAFDDESPARSYYLDRDTGKVFSFLEDHVDAETEEIAWQIEADGEKRYLPVPKLTLEEELKEQDSFVESLDKGELKERVAKVIESDHDGSKFQELVIRHRETREKWRAYFRGRSRERVKLWLKSVGLTAS